MTSQNRDAMSENFGKMGFCPLISLGAGTLKNSESITSTVDKLRRAAKFREHRFKGGGETWLRKNQRKL